MKSLKHLVVCFGFVSLLALGIYILVVGGGWVIDFLICTADRLELPPEVLPCFGAWVLASLILWAATVD